MVRFEQHSYFVRRRSRASGYTGALAATGYGRLAKDAPLFFQGWVPPLLQLDGASVLVLHLDRWLVLVFDFSVCLWHVSCVCLYSILVFTKNPWICSLFLVLFLGLFSVWTGPQKRQKKSRQEFWRNHDVMQDQKGWKNVHTCRGKDKVKRIVYIHTYI